MMKDYENCLKTCNHEHEQWHFDYATWMDEYQSWKHCEQSVIAIIFELERALPDHRIRLDRFYDKMNECEKILEEHRCMATKLRTTYIDNQCPSELKSLQQFGVPRCLQCEAQCVDALLQTHRTAAAMHEEILHEHDRLRNEYKIAIPKILALADRLQSCLGKE